MGFNKISAPSLRGIFVRELENMILSGELQVGEKLPSARDLAEQMGVSRTVVNAGLSELAGKGFLEVRPRVGVFVSDYRRNHELCMISDNPLLPLYYGSFREPCCSLWQRYYQLYGKESLIQYNEQLLTLIRNKKLDEAMSLSESHLRETISGNKQLYF